MILETTVAALCLGRFASLTKRVLGIGVGRAGRRGFRGRVLCAFVSGGGIAKGGRFGIGAIEAVRERRCMKGVVGRRRRGVWHRGLELLSLRFCSRICVVNMRLEICVLVLRGRTIYLGYHLVTIRLRSGEG